MNSPSGTAEPQQLAVGDFLPDLRLYDEKGRLNVLGNQVQGKAIVLLAFPSAQLPGCQQILRRVGELLPRLSAVAHVFGLSCDTPEDNARHAGLAELAFPILADEARDVARAMGIGHNLGASDFLGQGAFTCIVADPNQQVIEIHRDLTDASFAEPMTQRLEVLAGEEPELMGRFAPVLVIPRVFDAGLCRRMIEAYESGDTVETGVLKDDSSGRRKITEDDEIKVRRDHFVRDPGLRQEIAGCLARRVLPQIHKAFSYRVTRCDDFKIGCYTGDRGGHFRPHRDNNNLNAVHRRFAMSLLLNEAGPGGEQGGEYEGGYLRFPEFGPQLYRPGAGEAVIFSCSLLHEVLPVTAGQRYVLLSFLFGEEALQMARQRASGFG